MPDVCRSVHGPKTIPVYVTSMRWDAITCDLCVDVPSLWVAGGFVWPGDPVIGAAEGARPFGYSRAD